MTADPSSSFNSRRSFDLTNFDAFAEINHRKTHIDQRNIIGDHPRDSDKSIERSHSSAIELQRESNVGSRTTQNHEFPPNLKQRKNITSSSEAIRNLVIANADLINSFSLEDTELSLDDESFHTRPEELPAKMWWVPPMKSPSFRTIPSMDISSTPFSLTSSTKRPRVVKSAEELRQQVITECSLVEAQRQAEQRRRTSEIYINSNHRTPASPVELWWIPPINIPSDRSRSSATVALPSKATYIKTNSSTSKSFLNGNQLPNSLLGQPGTDKKISTEIRIDSHSRVPNNSENTCQDVFVANTNKLTGNLKFRDATPHHLACETDSLYFPRPIANATIGDLACKHIVNPMMTRLARLCTQQGQQYLEVLDDLQRACDDFNNACKRQGSPKKS